MKKINPFFLLLLAFCNYSVAQDTTRRHAQHMISFGCQFSPARNNDYDHDRHQISYRQPGYELMYKYLIPNERPAFFTALSGGAFYRQGSGMNLTGSNGGSDTESGNFQKANVILGVTQYFRAHPSRETSFDIGAGLDAGRLVYSRGMLDYTSWSMIDGVKDSRVKASTELKSVYVAIHIEMALRIAIDSKSSLLIGVRQYLETSDGFGAGKNFTRTAFAAISFR